MNFTLSRCFGLIADSSVNEKLKTSELDGELELTKGLLQLVQLG